MPLRNRARRLVAVILATGVLTTASVSPALAVDVIGDGTDDKITGVSCVRHDGGTDRAIAHCNDGSTNPAPDPTPNTDGDTDSNDGGNRRQGNEPFAVIDPTDPNTVIAGWNDYSQTDLGAGWQGFGYSRDGGETWVNSFVPGYPADTSAEGMASPLFGRDTEAGDPIAAFDNDGNLYVGGISFNRAGAINGHVYVARYDAADVAVPGPDYPADYRFTRIVGRGTPSRNFFGIFQDKPMLEVDRTGGDTDGNVYVCWSRFTGIGVQDKIFFSRSTNGGNTFSRPIQLSVHGFTGAVQGCDIAIEGDGDVYVTFRTFNDPSRVGENALFFARSTNGGASFSRPHKVRDITPYFPFDTVSRDCGDGAEACPTGFVFARVPLEPRSTADQSSADDGVWLVYNEIDPGTVEDSDTSYTSAGPGAVGRSVVYVVKSTDNGAHWSDPVKVDNAGGLGHQFFPDIDALGGGLGVVWQDSREDDCYSVQLPMGNTASATACDQANDDIVNTYVATSSDDGATWTSVRVSDVGHQPQYEMFGARSVPFQGDYNWVSIIDANGGAAGGLEAYVVWTDNRDVIRGTDPREATQDGFDVSQCLIDLGATTTASSFNGPRARSDAPFSGNNCGNNGGVDQNIYGNRVSVP
jgi:hypothetical protein